MSLKPKDVRCTKRIHYLRKICAHTPRKHIRPGIVEDGVVENDTAEIHTADRKIPRMSDCFHKGTNRREEVELMGRLHDVGDSMPSSYSYFSDNEEDLLNPHRWVLLLQCVPPSSSLSGPPARLR